MVSSVWLGFGEFPEPRVQTCPYASLVDAGDDKDDYRGLFL